MKVVMLGATGGTGRLLVDQALSRGHTVTAIVRNPAKLAGLAEHTNPRLHVLEGDVTDPDTLSGAIGGHDAVISALGPPARDRSTICRSSTSAVIRAMNTSGLSRLVVISAAGAHTDGDGIITRTLVKPILQRALKHAFADMLAMEELVQASSLEWTIMRPAMLTDKPLTRNYRISRNSNVRRGMVTRRADLAHAVLDAVDDPSTIRTSLGVTS
ncbi:NAD(P)-dependent oxidoreductase [Actinobacteria bacterium YIM 96077]|uniref:NAD(P)-dependent oxidoreductase n=1 Tax=Phytoactinopolyspora halophila TaxID=1981511 RepID=A0A329R2G2_9ACTN|nr:NAD(P)-binding oxidoreductase [Phytoactinopolyspora halophila]AYY15469.1 NAD(P)-dependent oxidoreductase [Actinobacteria bacterium YIM 96077]RAW17672.1 NAD(P)-dependent oxidoreductase [Phytoactinopolyspora halophila]